MTNTNGAFNTWSEVAPQLIAVAAGREAAELVLRNLSLVNVQSREVLPDWQVAVVAGRFAYVGPDASHCIGKTTEVVDCGGRFLIPGLCDAHMHVESGMLTPAQFTAAVIPHGTTSMFADPHEIANVLGLAGVRLMHDEAMLQPINIYMQVPSCVPSAKGLETTGAEITAADVAEAMHWPGIIGLGEMMNFPGVIAGDEQMLAEMAACMEAGKVVGGHYSIPDCGASFAAYVAGGAADDHEGTAIEDSIARVRLGMRSMMRFGSAWYDVESQIKAVTEKGLDPRNFLLCTDDCHAGTLVNDGHIDRAVRHAIECGCDPLIALQMATINTASHFGLERELGSIAPGRRADMILTSDLQQLPIEVVWARGQKIAEDKKRLVPCPHLEWPDEARHTVHVNKALCPSDFEITAPAGKDSVVAKVIGIIENQAPTQALTARLPVRDGLVEAEDGVYQVAVIERHKGSGRIVNAFVSGFNYQGHMAMASTVSHDSHQMIIVGTSRADMAAAANRLREVGGGITLFRDGQERALVELPIAGLISDAPAQDVAAMSTRLVEAMAECGCNLNNANIQHSFLGLVVIPELRISDLGLVDVTRYEVTDLFCEDADLS